MRPASKGDHFIPLESTRVYLGAFPQVIGGGASLVHRWAWMNFTWFASAYDTDDALYRVVTLVQITGVLILAAGVPRAFDDNDSRSPSSGTW